MHPALTWIHRLRERLHDRLRTQAALRAQVEAVERAQAVIEFSMDGTILAANDNFLALMGYQRDEVIGRHHRMFVPEEERASEAYQAFWQQLGDGRHHSGQFRRIARDGHEIWIQGSYSPVLDRHGRPQRVIKHATDVTAERLQRADMEGRLAAIDRAQAVISFDMDGIILDVNDNFLAALGYERDEVVGRHHRIFVHQAERDSEAYLAFWHKLHSGAYHRGLFRRRHKNGSDVWIQASYNPIFDMAGRPFKVVKYATDVTVQTLAARALQQSLGTLSDTVPAIAGQARDANRLADHASDNARSGGSVVQDLVVTIGGINERAQNMAEIVAMMNSIAFQTNILALNASVEAAHAGSQGRGFAVVASEVRALAQRSAQSARDIRDLIQSVTDALAECSGHAELAGTSMQAIVTSTGQVNERIRQIADAADAQAGGIAEVNRNIDRLHLAGGDD